MLLQKGIFAEETEGNLDAAVQIYEGSTDFEMDDLITAPILAMNRSAGLRPGKIPLRGRAGPEAGTPNPSPVLFDQWEHLAQGNSGRP